MPSLSVGELARRWQVHPNTLRRWRDAGEGPPAWRLGQRWRYDLEAVQKYEREAGRSVTADPVS